MGLPILLKDLIDVKGMYTSAGNWSLRNSYPSTDSGVAAKLREHGVVILGKLGLSEYANYFGRQASGFSNLTGQVLHGLDTDQNPSGSSSGSGSAGAAALSMLTIGTETSGSITSPSRSEGLVGIRPTIGLVPGYGIAPIVASQDTAGPMDRTVANAALTLTVDRRLELDQRRLLRQLLGRPWGSSRTNRAAGAQPAAGLPLRPRPPVRQGQADRLLVEHQHRSAGSQAGARRRGRDRRIRPDDQRPTRCLQSQANWYPEMHLAIDRYYERLGADAPINSLARRGRRQRSQPARGAEVRQLPPQRRL